jgi:hypothetical protein
MMIDNTVNGARAIAPWQRIARLLLNANALVLAQGSGVIVKWDGLRDNGKIYTVVWEGGTDEGPRFRAETDNLESALGPAFSSDTSAELGAMDRLAELLATIDDAARRNLVILIRMTPTPGGVSNHVLAFGTVNENLGFEKKGDDLVMMLEEVVAFLEKILLTHR